MHDAGAVHIQTFPTVAEVILQQLRLWGVRRIYGVVGDSIFDLMDATSRQKDIALISVKHESVAAMMASAEAKLTGQLTVCTAHMGPGLANLANGLGDAFLDKAPVLAITGQAPLAKIGTPYKQYIHQQQFVQALSSFSQLVVHPDSAAPLLTTAMFTAESQRTVAHLSIPEDVFRMTTVQGPRERPRIALAEYKVESPYLQQAVQIMQSARKPILLVGSGLQAQRQLIQTLAETWGCGMAMSYGAVGIIPDSHPYMLNGLGEGGNPLLTDLFKQSDVIVTLDTNWWPEYCRPLQARVIQIASQPQSFNLSIPPDSGIVGDVAAMIMHMIEKLKGNRTDPEWIDSIKRCKQTWSAQNAAAPINSQPEKSLHPVNIIKALENCIREDAIIALDEGDSTLWFMRHFRAKQQHVLYSAMWRSMGYGLPAAMAAKLCSPHSQVICLTGDGGLAMVLADLLTATRYKLPIVVIVFHNGTLQMEQDKMLMKGLQPAGTAVTNPDFVKVAEACGWVSQRIDHEQQLEEMLKQSLTSINPMLLDVPVAAIRYPEFQT